jgi:hypothetical protein
MWPCSAVIILTGRPGWYAKRWAWDTARSVWIIVMPAQIRVYIARIDPHVSYGSSVERVRSAIVWRRKQLVKEKIKDRSGRYSIIGRNLF